MVYKHIIRGRYTSLLQHGSRHPTKRYNGTFRSSYVSPSKTDDDTEAPHYHRERLIRDDTSSSSSTVKKYDLLSQGCIPYSRSWAYQQVLLNYRLEQRRTMQQASSSPRDRDCVMMLEVSPVYTLGRGADEAHLTFLNKNSSDNNAHYFASAISEKLSRTVRGPGTARLSLDRHTEEKLRTAIRNAEYNIDTATETFVFVEGLAAEISPVVAPNGVPIYRVERGGEVTFHGPSQLVVYPMFDLKHGNNLFKEDLHWYLRRIEEVIIQTLQCYGIEGNRDNINTGVWVGESKIAAVGISSSRWITTHGFALNVDPDLSCFDTSIILPCGIEDRGVTSMGKILRDRNEDRVPSIREVSAVVTEAMEDVFGILIVEE